MIKYRMPFSLHFVSTTCNWFTGECIPQEYVASKNFASVVLKDETAETPEFTIMDNYGHPLKIEDFPKNAELEHAYKIILAKYYKKELILADEGVW